MHQKYSKDWLIQKQEEGESFKFIFFWGNENKYNEEVGKFCFSQWFESHFINENIIYKTSEHWMMAQKAKLFNDQYTFDKIILCNKPGEAKELGRQVINFNAEIWEKHRFEIVKTGNIHKFTQNKKIGEYLVKTGNRILVEASPIDAIWGNGLSQDSKIIENVSEWRGLNLLGFALMEVRDLLKTKI
jgi:ribA/ribD-fused uncharacterized protein